MNKKRAFKDLCQVIHDCEDVSTLQLFLKDLLTPKEMEQVTERWQIVKRLHAGHSQRKIAHELGTGIMTVTRGSAALKRGSGGFKKILNQDPK